MYTTYVKLVDAYALVVDDSEPIHQQGVLTTLKKWQMAAKSPHAADYIYIRRRIPVLPTSA